MTDRTPIALTFIGLACFALASASASADDEPSEVRQALPPASFTFDPGLLREEEGSQDTIFMALSPDRPEGIVAEPEYRGEPRYAIITVGDGPEASYFVVLDEPEEGEPRIFVDRNRNGDLTDDGDGAFDSSSPINDGRGVGHQVEMRLAVSRAPGSGTEAEPFAVRFELKNDPSRQPEAFQKLISVTGLAGGVGEVVVDGKPHRAILVTETLGQVYPKRLRSQMMPFQDVDELYGDMPPIAWLSIDLNDNGTFGSKTREGQDEMLGLAPGDEYPIRLGETTYTAEWSADARSLVLIRSGELAHHEPLPVGAEVPDFTVAGLDGAELRLSDLRGKVVVLDLWATWCGPCVKALPELDRIHRETSDQGVVVFAVAAGDEPAEVVKRFLESREEPLSVLVGIDETASTVWGLCRAEALPTTLVIDREGRVAASFIGYRKDDTRVTDALRTLGVALPEG